MKVLRDKSGVSLMFVLASMMMLMIIGVSVIIAAGLNAGAAVVQHDRTQLALYASSMDRTIKEALDVKEADGTFLLGAQTLGGRILREAISNVDIFPVDDPVNPIKQVAPRLWLLNADDFLIDIGVDIPAAAGIDAEYIINISVDLAVNVSSYQRYDKQEIYVGYDEDDAIIEILATPMIAEITGEITVTIMTTYDPGGGLHQDVPFTYSTETVYRLEDSVVLVEDDIAFDYEKTDMPTPGEMMLMNGISWTVVRHDTFG